MIPDASFRELELEFLIPAALEQQITAFNAGRIRTRVPLEGANGPTTPEADDILAGNGVVVVPDVIANAGGVTVSYFCRTFSAISGPRKRSTAGWTRS